MSSESNPKVPPQPQLRDDPTFDQLKEWACETAAALSKSFNGHNPVICAIPVVLMCEQFLSAILERAKDNTSKAIQECAEELGEDGVSEVMEIIQRHMDGDDLPVAEVMKTSQRVGEVLGSISMVKSIMESSNNLSSLKFLLATTALSFDERANAMGDMNEALGLDLSEEDKLSIRNHLKGGSNIPVGTPSTEELDDTCNQLFG